MIFIFRRLHSLDRHNKCGYYRHRTPSSGNIPSHVVRQPYMAYDDGLVFSPVNIGYLGEGIQMDGFPLWGGRASSRGAKAVVDHLTEFDR